MSPSPAFFRFLGTKRAGYVASFPGSALQVPTGVFSPSPSDQCERNTTVPAPTPPRSSDKQTRGPHRGPFLFLVWIIARLSGALVTSLDAVSRSSSRPRGESGHLGCGAGGPLRGRPHRTPGCGGRGGRHGPYPPVLPNAGSGRGRRATRGVGEAAKAADPARDRGRSPRTVREAGGWDLGATRSRGRRRGSERV